LRAILRIVDAALSALSAEFEGLYAKFDRPSIAPERLLRALLLQAFYSVPCPAVVQSAGPLVCRAVAG
jgi:hypothetical protein